MTVQKVVQDNTAVRRNEFALGSASFLGDYIMCDIRFDQFQLNDVALFTFPSPLFGVTALLTRAENRGGRTRGNNTSLLSFLAQGTLGFTHWWTCKSL